MDDKFLPTLRVSGKNYEIGKKIGETFKDRIKKALEAGMFLKIMKFFDKRDPDWFEELHENGKKAFPQYIEELRGISDGADVEYRDIALISLRHSFSMESCTTINIKTSKNMILAHNEDHEFLLGKYSYILIVKLDNGTSFLSHSYPGCLPGPTFWFNSHGIGMGGNSLTDPALKMGVPKALHDRAMLESKTLKDALFIAQSVGRSGGYSYNLFSKQESKLINLETTSSESSITEVKEKFVHSNHYISNKFNDIPHDIGGSSDRRLKIASQIIKSSESNKESALNALFDEKVHLSPENNTYKTPFGDFMNATACTALFEVDNEINLRIYPPSKDRNKFIQFSDKDLN